MMRTLSQKTQGQIIQLGVVLFWSLFWLLNTIDKFASQVGFWVGKDRLAQFTDYFSSANIHNPNVSLWALIFIALLELLAFVFVTGALIKLLQRKNKEANTLFFLGTFVGLTVFGLFAIADQIFGDRVELLEHSIYWTALIISWGAYEYFPKIKK